MENQRHIRIGTRGSELALWQARHVAELIHPSGFTTEIVPIQTKGDQFLDVPMAKIGSKGVFTEEIEQHLLSREIDIAVHSAKDLSSDIPDELELIAYTQRELANDVLISTKPVQLSQHGIRIGTSSTRRISFLRHFYPEAIPVSIRGNLQTRIRKMEAGECDALILAYAGVHRLGYGSLVMDMIETSYFVPAVGQGALAIECHKKMSFEKKEMLRRWVNDETSETCIRAERAFLKKLQGGCSIPAFGYAHMHGKLLILKAGIISLDGSNVVKIKRSGSPDDAKIIGEQVGTDVLEKGGRDILKEIRAAIPA